MTETWIGKWVLMLTILIFVTGIFIFAFVDPTWLGGMLVGLHFLLLILIMVFSTSSAKDLWRQHLNSIDSHSNVSPPKDIVDMVNQLRNDQLPQNVKRHPIDKSEMLLYKLQQKTTKLYGYLDEKQLKNSIFELDQKNNDLNDYPQILVYNNEETKFNIYILRDQSDMLNKLQHGVYFIPLSVTSITEKERGGIIYKVVVASTIKKSVE